MKNLTVVLLSCISVFCLSQKTSAQIVLYTNNFNSVADSMNSPALPTGWVNSATDSAWSFDNQKPNKLDSLSPRDQYTFMCDNKVIRLNTDVAVTFSTGIPAKGYKNIKMIWSERISTKWVNFSTLHVDFSIDSGKT
ncbi:MAG: hypothetical protein NTX03_11980 [Bacteroidetes bacterium]|nr:hypothetical protein [Bacteroidota bacterium]